MSTTRPTATPHAPARTRNPRRLIEPLTWRVAPAMIKRLTALFALFAEVERANLTSGVVESQRTGGPERRRSQGIIP